MTKAAGKKVVAGSIRPSWVAPSTALSVLVALAGAFAAYDGFGQDPVNAVTGGGGAAAVIVAGALIAYLAVATKREIAIDMDGITQRVGTAKAVHIDWSEPHDFYYRAYTGTSTPSVDTASVSAPDGRHIDIDALKLPDHPNANLPALAEQYSAAANLANIKKRLKAGKKVTFGEVTLTEGAIEIEDRSHSREGGLVLQIDHDQLKVSVDGKWVSTQVSVKDVPNYHCLLRAIGQIRHARAPT